MIVIRMILLVLVLFAAATSHSGQIDPERGLHEARVLYRRGLFDEAIAKLGEVISELERLRDLEEKRMELADAYFLSGMSYIALRDEISAKKNFERTATLDPDRVLDPDVYAPKVIELYLEAWHKVHEPVESPSMGPEDERTPFGTGARVRANSAIVGKLLSVDQESLTILTDQLHTITMPRNEIATIEISTGRERHTLMGALIGAGTGALIGLAEGSDDCLGEGCFTRGENIGYGALGAGMIGALIGALYQTDHWVTVPSTGVGLGMNVSRQGARVSMTWSF